MPKIRPLLRIALGLAGLALVSACTEPPAMDYRQKYALEVHPEVVNLVLPVGPTQPAWSSDQDAAFKALVAGYLDRGHGPMTIAAALPTAPGPVNTAAIDALRQRLVAAGVPANAIRVELAYGEAKDTVTVSYLHYEATLPTCGDWTGSLSSDPYNGVPPNFGCANQRNFGLMAADPLDLVRKRDVAPSDAQNSDRVVQKFRAGQPTAATPSPLQSNGAAGITTLH